MCVGHLSYEQVCSQFIDIPDSRTSESSAAEPVCFCVSFLSVKPPSVVGHEAISVWLTVRALACFSEAVVRQAGIEKAALPAR